MSSLNPEQFAEHVADIQARLRGQFPSAEIDIQPTGGGHAVLSRVVFPKSERGQGHGTTFMNELTGHADQHGYTVALTPSTDYGATSRARLERFYKGHGFVPNKGRRADHGISEAMYRYPK